jgi:phage virion morphogenesis protein
MAFNVQFNAGETRSALQRAIAGMEDATPLYEDVAEYMVDATRQRFIQGVGPDGKAWAPKKQSTLDRYRARGYGGQSLTKTLYLTGRLRREIQRIVNRDSVVIGSSLIYSGVMQGGATKGAFGRDGRGRPIPWGTIPARPWLGISKDDGGAIIEIADEYAGQQLGEEG